jgi:hypothetical protein
MPALRIDHANFFAAYRTVYGKLKQSQVNGIESLLTSLERDAAVTDARWAAYMLATVKHECDNTWQPIEEYGRGKSREYGKPVPISDEQGKTTFVTYYGRGYVQLTWERNYAAMSTKLGLGNELVIHPEKVLDPVIAYKIMSLGMRTGVFTTKKLADYINAAKCDYVNARRVINGLDKARNIAEYAEDIEGFLRKSLIA